MYVKDAAAKKSDPSSQLTLVEASEEEDKGQPK